MYCKKKKKLFLLFFLYWTKLQVETFFFPNHQYSSYFNFIPICFRFDSRLPSKNLNVKFSFRERLKKNWSFTRGHHHHYQWFCSLFDSEYPELNFQWKFKIVNWIQFFFALHLSGKKNHFQWNKFWKFSSLVSNLIHSFNSFISNCIRKRNVSVFHRPDLIHQIKWILFKRLYFHQRKK